MGVVHLGRGCRRGGGGGGLEGGVGAEGGEEVGEEGAIGGGIWGGHGGRGELEEVRIGGKFDSRGGLLFLFGNYVEKYCVYVRGLYGQRRCMHSA